MLRPSSGCFSDLAWKNSSATTKLGGPTSRLHPSLSGRVNLTILSIGISLLTIHTGQVNLGGNAGGASGGTNVGQGTRKAGAYGGSELGSRLGGAVGPPIIGGIVGSLAGEVVGEKVVKETGVDKKVKEAGDQLAGVIGRRQVNEFVFGLAFFFCCLAVCLYEYNLILFDGKGEQTG